MEELDTLLAAAKKASAPAAAFPELDAFQEAARDPLGAAVRSRVRSGRTWEEVAPQFTALPGVDPKQIERTYRQALARDKYSESQEDTLRYVIRRSIPGFSSGFQLGEHIKTERARRRIEAGTATQDDYDEVAARERLEEIDRQRTVGQSVVSAAARLPAMIGEFAAGAGALRAVGAAPASGAARSAVGRAANWLTTPAAGGVAAQAGKQAAMAAALTPVVPSMYLEQAARRAEQSGGAWYEPKNLGVEGGKAVVLNAFLGHAMRLAKSVPTVAGRGAASGLIGTGEQAAGDTALSYLEERFVPEAYQTRTRYGLIGHLVNGRSGEAMKTAATQVMTFAFFGAMQPGRQRKDPAADVPLVDPTAENKAALAKIVHEAERVPPERPRVPKPVVDAFADFLNNSAAKGWSAERTAKEASRVSYLFELAVKKNPNLSREEARGFVKQHFGKSDPKIRDFAYSIADTFQDVRVEGFTEGDRPVGAMVRRQTEAGTDVPRHLWAERIKALPPWPGEVRPDRTGPKAIGPAPDSGSPEAPGRTISQEAPEARPAGDRAAGEAVGVGIAGEYAGPERRATEGVSPTGTERRRPVGLRLSQGEELGQGVRMDPVESKAVSEFGQGNVFRLGITDTDGNPVARMILAADGDTIHVPWLGATGRAGGEGRGAAQPFGAAEMLSIARQIAELDPGASRLVFTASAGRIREGVRREIDLERLRSRDRDRVPPEFPPGRYGVADLNGDRPDAISLPVERPRQAGEFLGRADLPDVGGRRDEVLLPPRPPRKPGKVETLANAVVRFGGIAPDSEFKKYFSDANEAAQYGVPLQTVRKGGKGIDVLAREMHEAGLLPDPEPQTLIDALIARLKADPDDQLAAEAAMEADAARREAEAADVVAAFLNPDPEVAARLQAHMDEAGLTEQEQRVARLLAEGLSQADIGKRLGVTRARVGQIVQGYKKGDKTIPGITQKLGVDLEATIAAPGRESEQVAAVGRRRAKGEVSPAEVSVDYDPATGKLRPEAKVPKRSAAERTLKGMEREFERLSDEHDAALERGDDSLAARLMEEMVELSGRGAKLRRENRIPPGVTIFANPLNFKFLQDAIAWAGATRNAVGRAVLDFDTKHIFPRYAQNFTDVFTRPEGLGRVPFLARVFDPRGVTDTPEGRAVLTHRMKDYVGKNQAALWAAINRQSRKLFEVFEDGTIKLTNGNRWHMGDVFEAELRRPNSQPLTPGQKDWLHNTYKPVLDDLRAMARDKGIGYFLDQNGNPIGFEDGYFPRPAIGKKGKPSPTGPGSPPRGPAAPGSKSFSEKERYYKTEKEGADAGIIYDPDPISRVAKLIRATYKAVNDHDLANDPALRGKGKLGWLETEQARVNAPAFKGRYFEPEVARFIEKHFASENPGVLRQAIATANELSKLISLGYDATVLGVQGLLPLVSGTYKYKPFGQKAAARGVANFFKAVVSPDAMARYLERPEKAQAAREIVQAGGSVARLTDFMAGMEPGSGAEQLLQKIPVIGRPLAAGAEWSGRTFGAAIDTYKIEMWDATRDTVPPDERAATVERIENIAGSGRMEMIGLSPGRQLAERMILLAPSLYRSGLSNAVGIAQGGVSGALARRAVAGQIFATGLLAYAAGKESGLSDEEMAERFDPQSGKFLTVPLEMSDGSRLNVRFGNILTSYVRLLGELYEASGKERPAYEIANAAGKWYRAHSSPAIRTGLDLYDEANVLGEPQSRGETLAKAVTPISAQDLIFDKRGLVGSEGLREATVGRAALGAFGVQATPVGETEDRMIRLDAEAVRRFGGRRYSQLSLSDQAKVVAAVPEGPRPPAPPSAVAKAVENDAALRRKMFRSLAPGTQKELLDAGLDAVPGYDPRVEVPVPGVGRVEVPLTKDKKERYEALILAEYDRAVQQAAGRLAAVPAGRRKEFMQARLEKAKEAARAKLLRE